MRIKTKNLTKIYKGDIVGIKKINLEIGKGMFGLLGPNGAGKTTFMRILATLMDPTDGEAYVNNWNVINEKDRVEIRKILGYLPQEFGLYPVLTAYEFLDYMACLSLIKDRREREKTVTKNLKEFGIYKYKDRKLKTFSSGMKQRLGIAQALLNDPKLLIVDEPTAGLDPEERIRFRNLVSEISGERIVILSTHIVGDVEYTCNELAIIKDGSILERTSPTKLINSIKGKVWEVVVKEKDLKKIKEKYHVISTVRSVEGIKLRIVGDEMPKDAVKTESTLEDAYVYKIGEDNRI